MTRLLIAVITGGRPKPSDRPTDKILPDLARLGDVEYVVREDQADGYEPADGVPLNRYSVDWADEFARTHWRHPRAQFKPGGFHGAFTGREWAMRSADERGYDLVLQLDDNILNVGPINAPRTVSYGITPIDELVRIATEISLSTNFMMLGFQLSAVVPSGKTRLVRTGFPYSFFLEKTGPGRMPYYGPFEDDIMHAMEYGLNGGPWRTAGLIPTLTYKKESKSKTGMRAHYNAERGLELVRRYPANAKLVESTRTSSPVSKDRGIRHLLNTNGFTPVRVTDRERYGQARDDLSKVIRLYSEEIDRRARLKITNRAGRAPA